MVDISTLAPKVATDAIGCPHPLLVAKLVEAAQLFCRRAWVWRYYSQLFLNPGEDVYDIDLPPGANLTAIMRVHNNYGELLPTVTDLAGVEDDNTDKLVGDPLEYIMQPPNLIKFSPTPSKVSTMNVHCILTPSGTEIPEWMADEYGTVIVAGAKSQLLLIQDTAWFRPKVAMYYQNEFRKGLNAARVSLINAKAVPPVERII